jgi:hypothetical protein
MGIGVGEAFRLIPEILAAPSPEAAGAFLPKLA